MAFDEKKFLKAFASIGQTSSALDFAKINAAKSTGISMPDLSTIGKAATAKAKEEKTTWDLAKGAVSNTFGWLMSPVRGVENIVNDITDVSQGDISLGQGAQNIGHDILGFAAAALDPAVNVIDKFIPGGDYLDPYFKEHNETIHGGKATTGLNTILNIAGDKELEDLGTRGRNLASIAGLGLDIGADPLTYLSGGASAATKFKNAAKAAEEVVPEVQQVANNAPVFAPAERPSLPSIGDLTLGNLTRRNATPVAAPKVNAEGFTPTQQLDLNLAMDISNAAQMQRSARGYELAEHRWYEKKFPAKIDENYSERITARSKDAYDEGTQVSLETVDRASLAALFDGKNTINARAHLKGIEDANNIPPSERLSSFLGQNKKRPIKELLEEYTVGKPAKVRPAVTEPDYADYAAVKENVAGVSSRDVITALDDIVSKRVGDAAPVAASTDPLVMTRVRNTVRAVAKSPFISKTKNLNPFQQALIIKRLRLQGEESIEAIRLLEDEMIAGGKFFTDYNGGSLRVSDVLADMPPESRDLDLVLKNFGKSPSSIKDDTVREAVARAMARRSIWIGENTSDMVRTWQQNLQAYKNTTTPVKLEAFRNGHGLDMLKEAAAKRGMTPKEVTRLANIAKSAVTVDGVAEMTPEQVINAISSKDIDNLINGKIDKKSIARMNRAVGAALGHGSRTPFWQKLTAQDIEDGILMRHTTWWGRGEEIHNFRQGMTYMDSSNKATEAIFAAKMAQYPKEVHPVAWAYATRKYDDIEAAADFAELSPQAKELGLWMRDYVEHMFGSQSIYNDVLRGGASGVVAIRANATMQTVNKHLNNIGSNFRFTNTKGRPWFTTWELHNPDNPLQFVHDLQDALGRVTVEYGLIDDFVERAGQNFKSITHTATSGHPRFPDNTYFRKEDLQAFERLMKDMEKGPWLPKSKPQRAYFSGLRAWKTGVTIYSPSHHIRNLMGDSWLMWVAGYNNPQDFVRGFKVIAAYRDAYKGAIKDGNLEGMLGLIKGEDLQALKASKSSKVVTKYDANLTTEEIYTELFHRGQLPKMETIEDLVGRTPLQALAEATGKPRIAQPLNGSARAIATGVAEAREHFVRATHFIAAVEKRITPKMAAELRKAEGNLGKRREILADVYDDAAREVTKWHPDGRDLTRFEQSWARGLIPFYAWQRKAIPLVFETMARQPAKLTLYPKANYALQNMLGIETESLHQQFPNSQLYPSWMRWGGIGPLGDPQSDNPVAAFFGKLGNNYIGPDGSEYGTTNIDPGRTAIPFNSLFADMGGRDGSPQDIGKGVLGMLTPAIKIPFELMQGTRADTGAPIAKDQGGRGYLDYAANNTPVLSNLYSVLGKPGAALSENAQMSEGSGSLDTQRLINLLTAAGITGSGPYAKSAEFDVKEEMKRNAAK